MMIKHNIKRKEIFIVTKNNIFWACNESIQTSSMWNTQNWHISCNMHTNVEILWLCTIFITGKMIVWLKLRRYVVLPNKRMHEYLPYTLDILPHHISSNMHTIAEIFGKQTKIITRDMMAWLLYSSYGTNNGGTPGRSTSSNKYINDNIYMSLTQISTAKPNIISNSR